MNQQNFVLVTFTDDRRGRQRLAYAKEFASAAKAVLDIIMPVSEASILERRQTLAAQGRVLAVTSGHEPYFAGLPCLNPVDEDVVFRSGRREALVPFGIGLASSRALLAAAPWLKALGMSVLLYHTTWRRTDLPDSAPTERHLCEEALNVQGMLLSECDRYGLPVTSLLETADAVDVGIHLAALTQGSSFVVMTKGHDAVKGSYVETFAERSVVPYFIANDVPVQEATP